jgi:hypothetical protein
MAKAFIGVSMILIMSIGYVGVFKLLGQVLEFSFFWILSLLLGVLSGGLLGYYFAREEFELFERMRIYVICLVVGLVLLPLMVFTVNRHLDFAKPQMKDATLELLKPNYGQPFGYVKGEEVEVKSYKIILNMDGRIVEFFVETNPYPHQQKGGKVLVPVYAGALGVSYIHFSK